MNKKVYVIAALLSAGLVACNNEPVFKVEGEVTGAADKMLYLEQSGLEGIVPLDSVELGTSGTFSMTGKRPVSPDFYRLRIENKVINFQSIQPKQSLYILIIRRLQLSTVLRAQRQIRRLRNCH